MFLHLELTSKCTLRCHACPRTEFAGEFEVAEIPLSAIKNILSYPNNYSHILLCGDHGDPIYHTEFHNIINLIQKKFEATPIYITTCGNKRSEDWWLHLAAQLRPIDKVCFSIDGLREDSGNYRINSDWTSILSGIQILKEMGRCQLVWKWILFEYNLPYLIRGIKYAKEIGFDFFVLNKSYRHKNDTKLFKTDITIHEIKEILRNENIPTL